MSRITITGTTEGAFQAQTKAALEATLGSPIKKDRVVRQFLARQLHGGHEAGQNEHNIAQFFTPEPISEQNIAHDRWPMRSLEYPLTEISDSYADDGLVSSVTFEELAEHSSLSPSALVTSIVNTRLTVFCGVQSQLRSTTLGLYLREYVSRTPPRRVIEVNPRLAPVLPENVERIALVYDTNNTNRVEQLKALAPDIVIMYDLHTEADIAYALTAIETGARVLATMAIPNASQGQQAFQQTAAHVTDVTAQDVLFRLGEQDAMFIDVWPATPSQPAAPSRPSSCQVVTLTRYEPELSSDSLVIEDVDTYLCMTEDAVKRTLEDLFRANFPDHDGVTDSLMDARLIEEYLDEHDEDGKLSDELAHMPSYEILEWLMDTFSIETLTDDDGLRDLLWMDRIEIRVTAEELKY